MHTTMKYKTIDAIKEVLGENTYEIGRTDGLSTYILLDAAIQKDYVKLQESFNGEYRKEDFSIPWYSTILMKAIKDLNEIGIVQEEYEEFWN